ncbi:hypothetical protein [Saccharospirillum impatiens]|uniref:hypothetical protein n=1 Tax=Saccharospirillum impatiens TaxID=169438 RepID=UPI00041A0DA7|nr:hypothetical protein [Saccharospirillum impatiens]
MLKKALVLPLLAGLAIPALADDAKVLPNGVLRTTLVPSLTTFDENFDADGERQDTDSVSVNTLSLALEYGVNDWITAGLQWAPGYIISGEVDGNDSIVLSGANDLFLGAKFQTLGTNGYSRSDTMRFAVTPGIKIPISQYDGDEQLQNALGGDDFKPSRTDRGAWGIGARFSFDYLITPDFYINFYNQSSFFLETDQDYAYNNSDVTVQYGSEAIFEIEPNYTTTAGNGVQLSFGLPGTYSMTGETEIDGSGQDDASYSLEVEPNMSVFFTQWALPTQFKLGYSTTLAGENTSAANTISLQVKNFLRF